MRRRFRNQLVLNLDGGGRQDSPQAAPAELLQALADLLFEALGSQNNTIAVEHEACDAYQDHV